MQVEMQLALKQNRGTHRFPIAPYDPSHPLVFMHVPKTSGIALRVGLQAALAPRRSLVGLDASLFGGFRAFDTIDAQIRQQIYLGSEALPPHADFVSGHFAASTTEREYGQAQHLTVLREPRSRILSHWLFWRGQPADQLALWGEWASVVQKAEQPLEAFLADPGLACQLDSVQVRMLLWPHRLIPDSGFIDERHDEQLLDEALSRLDRFAFADLLENPRLRETLRRWCGRPVSHGRMNETVPVPGPLKSPLDRELTTRARDLLDARARLDLRLWAKLAQARLPDLDVECLRARTFGAAVMRYAGLMAA
jgi:hypothetical protein